MQIILATRNPSKAEQIKAIFKNLPISILTLSEAGIEGEAFEDGQTLEENSLKKAWYAHERAPGKWCMADDTGVFINELNGEPGVQAAYWAGHNKTTEETLAYIIDRLSKLSDLSGAFETVVAVISPEGEKHFFKGRVEGKFLTTPRCAPQPKMPYSPLFVPNGETLTWAEMDVEYENKISHRGKAFTQVCAFFEKFLST